MSETAEHTETRYPLFQMVKNDPDVQAYIRQQNHMMKELGYTEHGFGHIGVVTQRAGQIMNELHADDHLTDLTLVSAWLHDIGNIIGRSNHSQTGALMAFQILNRLHFDAGDIAAIVCAIGNHDEGNGVPVSIPSAVLILADKSDVRRSRVQNENMEDFDIHDRVNYSVTQSSLTLDDGLLTLCLSLDTTYSEIGEFFEIFMDRMLLCERAAKYIGRKFHLVINDQQLL